MYQIAKDKLGWSTANAADISGITDSLGNGKKRVPVGDNI
jgi:hypothetical protein